MLVKKEIEACFIEGERAFGRPVNVLLNNAGIQETKMFFENPAHPSWKRVVDIDLTAVIEGTGIAIERWTKGGVQGVVINTASQGGLIEMPFSPVYSAAKHGVVGFSRSCGILQNYGIRVNCICPDFVDTPMVHSSLSDPTFKSVIDGMKGKGISLITPELVADGMIQLIEDDTKSGQVLRVNSVKGIHHKLYGKL